MAAALITATVVSLLGLVATTVLGYTARVDADVLRHTTFGIFVTMITLLSHSMMMFYFIGKGRAVRDAAAEGGLPDSHAAEIARLRRPVFTVGTVAMALTMLTAILGASVDTQVLPPAVHGFVAYGALAANLMTFRLELIALAGSARIVKDVNRLLGA
jgi:hypothetical protein